MILVLLVYLVLLDNFHWLSLIAFVSLLVVVLMLLEVAVVVAMMSLHLILLNYIQLKFFCNIYKS